MKKKRGKKILSDLDKLGVITPEDKGIILSDYDIYLQKSKDEGIEKDKIIKMFEKKNISITEKDIIDYFTKLA